MRILDRYLAIAYLRTLLWTTILVLLLFAIIDLIQNASNFIDDTSLILRHYAVRLPVVFVMGLPFAAVIAGVFTATQFEKDCEFLPQRAAGVPQSRILAPLFAASLGVGLLGFSVQEWLLPRLAAMAQPAEERLFSTPAPILVGDSKLVALRYYPREKRVQWCVVVWVEDGRPQELIAEEMLWDARRERWRARMPRDKTAPQGSKRSEVREFGFGITPLDIEKAETKSVDMATGLHPAVFQNLDGLIQWLKHQPDDATIRLMLYDRLTYPFNSLALCLVGVPLAIPKDQRARILGILLGVGLCVIFIVSGFVLKELSLRQVISPEAAMGFPFAAFFAGGIALLREEA